ncbi:hypothetical protein KY345_00875 [Candidatus Woesearchaeota archaeon]|nr:hypothetical protein [Candidatus Woesearchaeota archaeon]
MNGDIFKILAAIFLGGCASAEISDKKTDDIYAEFAYNEGEQDSETSRIEFTRDGKRFFAAEHTHNNSQHDSKTELGIKQEVNLQNIFKGQASVYGDETTQMHSTDDSRIAFGWRGKIPEMSDMLFGGAIEKKTDASGDYDLFNMNIGKQVDNLILKAGYANQDEKDIYLGTAMLKMPQDFLGIGGKVNADGKGQVNAIWRHCAKDKKGPGWEVLANSDLDGKTMAQALFALDYSQGNYSGFTDLDDNGLNDLSRNIADYCAGWDHEKGSLVTKLKLTKNKEDETYLFRIYKTLGDLGPLKNIAVGTGLTFQDIANSKDITSYNGTIATEIGPVGLYYEANKTERGRTEHTFYVWFTAGDVIKLFRKGK